MRPVIASLVLALAIVTADASASVLYKLVDPLGRVTYTNVVPQAFDGTVTRIDVDTSTTAISPERIPEVLSQAPVEYDLLVRRRAEATGEERLRLAHQRVDAAHAALEDARNNSLADDWIYLGSNNPLGMRRMPRPEYRERLQRLEADVIAAEDALSAVQREFR